MIREPWQPPVTGPEAVAEFERIRDDFLADRNEVVRDDYGDHGDDVAWLLDYAAALAVGEQGPAVRHGEGCLCDTCYTAMITRRPDETRREYRLRMAGVQGGA